MAATITTRLEQPSRSPAKVSGSVKNRNSGSKHSKEYLTSEAQSFEPVAAKLHPDLDFCNFDIFKEELERTASFFPIYKLYPNLQFTQFAAQGLFYNQERKCLQCYICDTEIAMKEIEGNSIKTVSELHWKKRPTCSAMRGEMAGNEPINGLSLYQIDDFYLGSGIGTRNSEIGNALDKIIVIILWLHQYLEQQQEIREAPNFKYYKFTKPKLAPLTSNEKNVQPDYEDQYPIPGISDCVEGPPMSYYEPEISARARRLKFFRNNYATDGTMLGRRPDVIDFTSHEFDQKYPIRKGSKDHKDMRMEKNRLESFKDPKAPWPGKGPNSAEALAKQGFFYLFENDKAQCAFCKGILRDWKPQDNVVTEHRKFFPSCPKLICFEVNNQPLPLSAKEKSLIKLQANSEDRSPHNKNKHVVSQSVLQTDFLMTDFLTTVATWPSRHLAEGEDIETPDYRQLSETAFFEKFRPQNGEKISRSSRTKTFGAWSLNSLPCKEDMAAAGFYHTPLHHGDDNVSCFACGIRIANWRLQDNPSIIHALYAPRCIFVLRHMGSKFITTVHNTFRSSTTLAPSKSSGNKRKHEEKSHDTHKMAKSEYGNCVTYEENTEPWLTEDQNIILNRLPKGTPFTSRLSSNEDDTSDTIKQPLNDTLATADMGHLAVVEFRTEQRETKSRLDLHINRLLCQGSGGARYNLLLVRHLIENKLRDTGDDDASGQHFVWRVFEAVEQAEKFGNLSESDYVMQCEQMRNDEAREAEDAEKRESGNVENLEDWQLCKICMDKRATITFLPCGHFCSCRACIHNLRQCPICRTDIRGTVHMRLPPAK